MLIVIIFLLLLKNSVGDSSMLALDYQSAKGWLFESSAILIQKFFKQFLAIYHCNFLLIINILYFIRIYRFFFTHLSNFILYRFIPESARWLNLKGRTEEVRAILLRIALINKKKLPDNVEIVSMKLDESIGIKHFQHLFTPKKIAVRSLIQGYAWYGLYSFCTDSRTLKF